MKDKIIEILKEEFLTEISLDEVYERITTRIDSLYFGGVSEKNRTMIANHLFQEIWDKKIYKCMPENEIGYEYVPMEEVYKIVDELIPMISYMLQSKPTPEKPIIEQIVLKVLDGMVGIGGIPGNEDFCNEFDMSLRAAMDVSQPTEISEEEIIQHIEQNCRNEHDEPMFNEQAYYEGAKWALSKGAKPISEEDKLIGYIDYISELITYIGLLGRELDELAVLAHLHGWRTIRKEEGEKARAKLNELAKSLLLPSFEAVLKELNNE